MPGDEPCKHWEGNIYLKKIQMHDINKTVILNRSYWKSIKGGEVMSTGLHTDVFQQDDKDGRWYIFHRIIQHTWTKNSGFINSNKNINKIINYQFRVLIFILTEIGIILYQ